MGILGSLISGIVAKRTGERQTAEGKRHIANSEDIFPENENFEQRLFLNGLEKKTKGYYTGSMASSLTDELEKSFSSVKEGALSLASGGGADVTSLMRNNSAQKEAFNGILGTLEGKGLARDQMNEALLDKISQRSLDLDLLRFQNERYEGQRLLQSGEQNKMAGQSAFASFGDQLFDIGATMGLSAITNSAKGVMGGTK